MNSKSGRDTSSTQEELDNLGRLMEANTDHQRTRRPKDKNPIKNDSDEYSNTNIINPHPFELIKLQKESFEKRSNKSLKNSLKKSSKKSSNKSMTAGFGGANKNASKVRTATATGNTKVRKAVVRSKSRI